MNLAQALPDLMKGLPAAFVTLVIGLIAAGIAYRQYRIARAKFKLDLFEKRHAVFLETWAFISKFFDPNWFDGRDIAVFRQAGCRRESFRDGRHKRASERHLRSEKNVWFRLQFTKIKEG